MLTWPPHSLHLVSAIGVQLVVGVCGLTFLISRSPCTPAWTGDLGNPFCYHGPMKSDRRMSIKDYLRNKNLKFNSFGFLFYTPRQFWGRMNGCPWPKDGRPVAVTHLLNALRESLVKSFCRGEAFSFDVNQPSPATTRGLESHDHSAEGIFWSHSSFASAG